MARIEAFQNVESLDSRCRKPLIGVQIPAGASFLTKNFNNNFNLIITALSQFESVRFGL